MSETSNHFCPQCGRQVSSAGVPDPLDDQQAQCARCRRHSETVQNRAAFRAQRKPSLPVKQPCKPAAPASFGAPPGPKPQAFEWSDGKIVSACIIVGAVLACATAIILLSQRSPTVAPPVTDAHSGPPREGRVLFQESTGRFVFAQPGKEPHSFDVANAVEIDPNTAGKSGRPIWEEFARVKMEHATSEAERAQIMAELAAIARQWVPRNSFGDPEVQVKPSGFQKNWASLLQAYANRTAAVPADVAKILGPPDRVARDVLQETWHYQPFPPQRSGVTEVGVVEFWQGRISKITPPEYLMRD